MSHGNPCLNALFDLFGLMLSRDWLFWTAPLWIPYWLMAYIWFYFVTQSLPKLLRLRRSLR
ncbi:MAG: hypothetical protein OEX09_01980 [Candidatus Bathyarchaeota archaeon]|nr:hypothetical protein [Candidatus Bathyarchaeota archaeon]